MLVSKDVPGMGLDSRNSKSLNKIYLQWFIYHDSSLDVAFARLAIRAFRLAFALSCKEKATHRQTRTNYQNLEPATYLAAMPSGTLAHQIVFRDTQ